MKIDIKPARPSWAELVAHDPLLDDILAMCHEAKKSGQSSWRFYEVVKSMISSRVGWNRPDNDFMKTSDAYEVAMEAILGALGL